MPFVEGMMPFVLLLCYGLDHAQPSLGADKQRKVTQMIFLRVTGTVQNAGGGFVWFTGAGHTELCYGCCQLALLCASSESLVMDTHYN